VYVCVCMYDIYSVYISTFSTYKVYVYVYMYVYMYVYVYVYVYVYMYMYVVVRSMIIWCIHSVSTFSTFKV